MALLLLSLGVSLVSAQQLDLRTIVRRNYNIARVSGDWFSVSMASDDMKRIEENGDLRVFIQKIKSLEDGGLKFYFQLMLLGQCVEVPMVCEKTEKNGECTISYEGENRVLLAETDYRVYATFHLLNLRNGTETQVLALYVCKKYGLGPQNIVSLIDKGPYRKPAPVAPCPQPRPPRPSSWQQVDPQSLVFHRSLETTRKQELWQVFEDICENPGLPKEQIVALDPVNHCQRFRDRPQGLLQPTGLLEGLGYTEGPGGQKGHALRLRPLLPGP
ncbi:epididymal-specific lipocalin-9-like [Equus quagga]|uniref:epididymal-specific lipocalin-9-like n=1 Tax=Equus quagga TaxID=89248 RepID=UPI001EE191BA|nr:epididymal-specific lipocalin-9-like [Equus quagga]